MEIKVPKAEGKAAQQQYREDQRRQSGRHVSFPSGIPAHRAQQRRNNGQAVPDAHIPAGIEAADIHAIPVIGPAHSQEEEKHPVPGLEGRGRKNGNGKPNSQPERKVRKEIPQIQPFQCPLPEAVPTVGRKVQLLCKHPKQDAQHQTEQDPADALPDGIALSGLPDVQKPLFHFSSSFTLLFSFYPIVSALSMAGCSVCPGGA